jgi:hypothetical protein
MPPDKRLRTGLSVRCRKAWGSSPSLAIFSFPSIYADLPRLVSRGAALCRPREFPRTHLLPTFLALSESSFRLSRILRISCHFQSFLAYKFQRYLAYSQTEPRFGKAW